MKNDDNVENTGDLNGVAIIGMAGRFPGAKNIDEFWRNLENGVECIKFYTEEELLEAGIAPEVLKNPYYMKAKGEVGDVDMFDASFFGINPREAEVTDPQHRMLLECAWEAMENACYDSSKYDGLVGMFAGKSMDYYLLLNVFPRIKKEISAGSLQAAIGNDKDSLTTTIAYRMNLMGPVITIQTSSSTSLVAVCVACQSLLTYQCDIALAGGITAGPPIRSGYLFQSGGIWSDDGHTRAFDAKSTGFVPGAGMGLVTLKRLEDAVADRDNIWAVIKGFAVNNDGCNKVSYAAPSVDAQAQVVAQAMAAAGVHPETISYIETHGTGTNLGDPIEMTALTQAFRASTDKKQFCAIGSAKTNIGHLDNAAGIAGLIKASLALKHKKIPVPTF
jgi:phthiocerol/phenolphthiocerol synthesis type-I polyketide synthase E